MNSKRLFPALMAALVLSGTTLAAHAADAPQGTNPDGWVHEASLKNDLQYFKDEGQVKGNVTVEQVLDRSFVDAAVKDLGPYIPQKITSSKTMVGNTAFDADGRRATIPSTSRAEPSLTCTQSY